MNKIFLLVSIGLLFSSCKNDDSSSNNTTKEIGVSNVTAEVIASNAGDMIEDINADLDEHLSSSTSRNKKETQSQLKNYPCAVITITKTPTQTDPTTTYKISFPETGCIGRHGNVHKGALIINKGTKAEGLKTTTAKITSENYSINGHKIKDGSSINSETTIIKLLPEYEAQNKRTSKLEITTSSGSTIVRNGEFTTDIKGTKEVAELKTYGSSTNTDSGISWTSTIPQTTPLINKTGCSFVTQGVVTYSIENKFNYTLDYGNGTCDNKAVLTKPNGSKVEITLTK